MSLIYAGEKHAMTVREIVKDWLIEHGYDGLFNEDCGCALDMLMTCEGDATWCEPGHKIPCNPETCPAGGGCEYHIGPKEET
jgi:hypothetical protein